MHERGVCVCACAWHVKLQGTADVSCDSICQLVNAALGQTGGVPRSRGEGGIRRMRDISNDATATLNASLGATCDFASLNLIKNLVEIIARVVVVPNCLPPLPSPCLAMPLPACHVCACADVAQK